MILNNPDVLGLRFYLKGNIHAIAINRVSKYRYGYSWYTRSFLYYMYQYIKTIGATDIDIYNDWLSLVHLFGECFNHLYIYTVHVHVGPS